MNRSLQLNRSLGAPTTQDLTVGLVASIVSLAVTMLQQLEGTDRNNAAVLMQALAPIQDQLVKLLRRLKVARLRHGPRMSAAPAAAAALTSPRRSVPASPARAVNTTFPTAPGDRTLPTAPFYEYPPGWLDNSQEVPDLSNIQDISLDYGISGEGIDWPRDDNFSIREDPDTSASFQPTMNSTMPEANTTFNTSTTGPLPTVGSPRTPQSPRRVPVAQVASVQRPANSTIPYQVRESANRRNLDGSLTQASRTVSGPDVSMVRALETSMRPFATRRS